MILRIAFLPWQWGSDLGLYGKREDQDIEEVNSESEGDSKSLISDNESTSDEEALV